MEVEVLGFRGCSHPYRNVDIAKSVRSDRRIFDSSQWWIFVGKALIYNFPDRICVSAALQWFEANISFSTILITRLTSCLKKLKRSSFGTSFALRAFFCYLSRIDCLISAVMNGFGHDLILMRLICACSFSVSRNKLLNTST